LAKNKEQIEAFRRWLEANNPAVAAVFDPGLVQGIFALADSEIITKDHVLEGVNFCRELGYADSTLRAIKKMGAELIRFQHETGRRAPAEKAAPAPKERSIADMLDETVGRPVRRMPTLSKFNKLSRFGVVLEDPKPVKDTEDQEPDDEDPE
jgi:hypothetical protein